MEIPKPPTPSTSSFAWMQRSTLPTKLLTRLFSLMLGLAIVGMADAAMALLKQGDSGSAVQDLQNRLSAVQCYEGPVTGYFGPLTRSAVEFCQQRAGINVDGVVGPQTMAALNGQSPTTAEPVSAVAKNAASNDLQRGSRGQAVVQLQQQLKSLGLYTSRIDGDFGPLTERAVAALQRMNGLSQTGIYGEREQQLIAATPVAEPFTTASTLNGTIGRDQLSVGDAGQDVQQLQAKLKDLRYFDSAATGYYGQLTKLAVESFQTDKQLPRTGVADQQTLQALGIAKADKVQANAVNPPTPGTATPFSSSSFTEPAGPEPTQTLGSAQISQGGRFVVIIPQQGNVKLNAVKQLVPDALEGKSSIGSYIQAGAFSSQSAADQQSRFLQAYGLDARVAYR